MSYILDALKKSEQQRGHNSIPNVQTIHSSSLNYRDEKKTYWPYILIIAVTLNLVAILYFILNKEKPLIDNTIAAQPMTPVEPKKTTVVEIPQTQASTQASTQAVVEQASNNKSIKQRHSTPDKIATEKKEINNNQSSQPESTNIASNQVIDFYDLPDAIQQQLPAIIVTAHVYSSNPLQRSIVINNNFMEEGEYVIDDLILNEITADGAIFDYHGTLFHYGIVTGWQ